MGQSQDAARLARVTRGGRTESEHFGQVVIARASGVYERSVGNPDHATFLRSSAKPFQALGALSTGAGEAFGWSDEEVAILCSSHYAEPDQLEFVRGILAKGGVTEEDLGCGAHPPINVKARDALIRAGLEPTKIHNNCSGKHAGMLAACRHQGWELETYLRAEHPLQGRNREVVARYAEMDEEAIPVGVDGCGVPTFYLPIGRLAVMYARLATETSAERVRGAMVRHPRLVSGTGHLTARLGEHLGERVISKGGAEGVFGMGLPGEGLGIAIKCSDGSSRALGAIACSALAEFLPGVDEDELREKIVGSITNTRGETVGAIESVWKS